MLRNETGLSSIDSRFQCFEQDQTCALPPKDGVLRRGVLMTYVYRSWQSTGHLLPVEIARISGWGRLTRVRGRQRNTFGKSPGQFRRRFRTDIEAIFSCASHLVLVASQLHRTP